METPLILLLEIKDTSNFLRDLTTFNNIEGVTTRLGGSVLPCLQSGLCPRGLCPDTPRKCIRMSIH